jgi:predicted PurR-regulated permease PerM
MLALDRRTGQILTTVTVYVAIAGAVYLAHQILAALLLALLFAYLVEPLVGWLECRFRAIPHPRAIAISTVYLGAALILGAGAYFVTPTIVDEGQRLYAAASGATARMKSAMPASQAELVSGAIANAASAAATAAHDAAWFLAVPFLAILFLGNRARVIDRIADFFRDDSKGAAARRTLHEVDCTLAEYARAELILSSLSALFYTVAMAALGFPYPIVLGVLGGVMELVPALGWIAAAAAILLSGAAAHGHWLWMALLLGTWRLVQDFVNSPRVMSERLELDASLVFLAMVFGGQLGGIVGVVFSVPAVAVLRNLWDERRSMRLTQQVEAVGQPSRA